MGNSTNAIARTALRNCIDKGKPFLICRCDSWLSLSPETVVPMWTLETLRKNGAIRSYPLTGVEAMEAIREHNIPMLHKIDGNNCIWGDERFKEIYKKKRKNDRFGDDEQSSEGI